MSQQAHGHFITSSMVWLWLFIIHRFQESNNNRIYWTRISRFFVLNGHSEKMARGSLDLNTKDSVSLKPAGNLHTLRQGRASAHRAAHFSSLQCSHDSWASWLGPWPWGLPPRFGQMDGTGGTVRGRSRPRQERLCHLMCQWLSWELVESAKL